jgi:hypothetical protein
MSLNFNIEPFYDDYSEDKQFYRILFRPGYAVQARELTQLQTILQQQIKRQGDHLFKNGAMIIPGQISYDAKTPYVKLKANTSSSTLVKTFSILSSIVGKTYRGATSGVEALILTATPLEVVNGVTEADTLFVKYTRGTGKFVYGEIISPIDGSSGLDLQVEEFGIDANTLGTGTTATIQQGVYYIKNNFVLAQAQTTVLAKYSNTASVKAGLQVVEEIVYPEEDESLLDNALGSPNYAAPGAARYYIDLVLTSKPYDTVVDADEFVNLLTLKDGQVQFLVDRTEYAQIEKTLARRTYDESGDYTVRDFPIEVREYRNNDRGLWGNSKTYVKGDIVMSGSAYYKCVTDHTSPSSGTFSVGSNWLADTSPPFNYGVYTGPTVSQDIAANITPLTKIVSLAVEPGKAYVRGYEIEKISTQYLTLDKARDLSPFETKSIDTSPGNYVIVKSPNALPSINTDVTFYDKYGSAGTVPSGGNIVATARVKQIQQHTSSPLTYKVFLFNLNVSAGMVFNRDAKYVFSNVGGTAATNFSGRIVPTLVELAGTLAASSSSTTVTGVNTTFVQDITQYDYVSINGTEYQVTGASITNNTIVIDTAISVTAGTKISRVEATIYEPDALVSYYRIPRYATNDTQNLNYSFYKKTTTSSGVTSATVSEAGYVFGVKSDTKNYIVVDHATGTHLTYVSSGPTSGQFTLTGDTTSSVTFTFGAAGTYDIIYNIRKSVDGSSPRLKTLTNITETVSLSAVGSTTGATLTKADGFELIKVISGTTDVTAKFKFDDGLRASHYDLCKIVVIPGQTVTGSVSVTYSYFYHSGSGDYFAVDSYTHATSNIQYNELPPERINSVDFRVLRNNDGTYSQTVVPKYGEETDIEYNYYYGRIDKLSLDTTGQFIITKGIPDAYPTIPASPNNSMDLYTFNVEPYTFTGSAASIVPNKIENKRYTMHDIGKLESRIKNLEYYTTLSLLEQNTINTRAYDNYGLERPQNGFMVDDFTGQGIGSTTSLDWKASIDSSTGELRPFYTQTNIALLENVGPNLSRVGRNYEVNGDLVTLKIASTTPLVSQARASHSESVNPFNIFVFNGMLDINPWNDTWFEVNRRPDIIINDTSQYDAVVSKAQADGVLGTVYKSWKTVWQGERITGTQRYEADRRSGDRGAALDAQFGVGPEADGWAHRVVQTQAFANTGTKTYSGGTNTFIKSSVSTKVIDDRTVSTALIPYMRSRKILFRGDSFKPETQMYAFFDNINVDGYITPAKRMVITPYGTTTIPTFAVDVNVGSNINNPERKTGGAVSSAYNYGEVLKEYSITSGGSPVLTGSSCIVLGQETYGGVTYAYVDNIIGTLHDNSGSTTYYLQAEFDSTRKVQKVGVVVTPSVLTSTHTGQLFGVFEIPNSSAMSFRTGERQLRFTDNAANIRKNESTSGETYYSAKGILETKERTVLSTKTASVVTEKIADKTETVTSTGTRVVSDTGWYDPLAQTFLVDIEGGAFITDVDLFFSARDENVPIKIQIRNVVNGYPGGLILPFSEVVKRPSEVATSANATAVTKFKFKSPVYLQNGTEYALVVISDSAKYRLWVAQTGEVDVNGSGLISSTPYAGVLFKSQNASTWTADQTQDMKFNINRAVFDTGSTASLTLVNQHVNNDVYYDLANINVSKTVLPNTKIETLLNNVDAIANNNIAVGLEEDIIFDQPQKLMDYVEENGTPSFSTTLTMSSEKNNISPVVNLGRCSATLVSNVIDSVVSDNEIYPEIGNATAKYVTKQVKLNQSATHLRILFDANIPNDAWVNVYYKIGLQSSNFDNAEYTLIPAASYTKSFTYTENSRQFYEVQAELNLDDFDIVQVKIVMKSANSSKVPRVKALRVISYA